MIDTKGYAFPVGVMVLALLGLWWHLWRARKGEATTRDRWMGALWAAMLVLGGWRVLVLVARGASPADPVPPPDAGVVK